MILALRLALLMLAAILCRMRGLITTCLRMALTPPTPNAASGTDALLRRLPDSEDRLAMHRTLHQIRRVPQADLPPIGTQERR